MEITIDTCYTDFDKKELLKAISEITAFLEDYTKNKKIPCFTLKTNHLGDTTEVKINFYEKYFDENPAKVYDIFIEWLISDVPEEEAEEKLPLVRVNEERFEIDRTSLKRDIFEDMVLIGKQIITKKN